MDDQAQVPEAHRQGPKEKRKVVRRDPEKRRLQNLQAQKKYREKLRRRLDDLETLAASVARGRQTTTPAGVGVGVGEGEGEGVGVGVTVGQKESAPTSDDQTSLEWDPDGDGAMGGSGMQVVPTASHAQAPLAEEPSPSSSSSSLDLSSWDTTTFIDPSYLVVNRDVDDAHAKPWYISSVDCGCTSRHVEVRSRRPGTYAYDLAAVAAIRIGDATPPDPYMNNLRVEMTCIVAAMWANCLQLGVSQSMFCEDEGVSPFYRAAPSRRQQQRRQQQQEEEEEDGVVRTVQRIFRTLKPDLRPVREQVTVRHHPCLDVVPFPTLRRNLLLGAAGAVDEDDLFHDMLRGLACWAGAGAGRRDRDAGTGRAPSGTPWDARSWEARPWFLRKYWALLGGEDGELVRQSEWWRSVRGEDGDIWSGSC